MEKMVAGNFPEELVFLLRGDDTSGSGLAESQYCFTQNRDTNDSDRHCLPAANRWVQETPAISTACC